MAYPIPRLTYEERCVVELRDAESIPLEIAGGSVTIDLDDFGQVNWFHIENLPMMHHALKALHGHTGPYRAFEWGAPLNFDVISYKNEE